MGQEKVSVLSAEQINRKIERIGHQIIELNYDESSIVLVGIVEQGHLLSERIRKIVESNSKIKVELIKLKLNKKDPINGTYEYSKSDDILNDSSVVLIDDVLNSGRTLIYAACEILRHPIKKLTTVVLIDRRHRKFPIKADFVGLTLSTTIQEHITVVLNPGEEAAYLE